VIKLLNSYLILDNIWKIWR